MPNIAWRYALLFAAVIAPGAVHSQPAVFPFGNWLAEDIAGGGVMDRLRTTMELAPDGRVTGFGGCNRFMGRAEIPGERTSFKPLASTRKACSPAVMEEGAKFHGAIEAKATWEVDAAQQKLSLFDGAGRIVVRFSLVR